MEEMLMQLVKAALQQQEVGMLTRLDGIQLLAYPLGQGAIVGLGVGFESADRIRIRSILRKRAENLPRFGIWLPSVLDNGSCFVITRVSEIRDGSMVLPGDVLAAAEELLS